ncbi:MAG: hypothetical protein COV72_06200 [Candidatus Omnitrophica bacterium CG11_big_fil_rev_8_21_14_0_20_42_13]|uniref:Uncharacterized protein n=1 Tax=Candidatus Ghiorseimicrobium undicola TaxID=1974746 RepID=A0A2H0LZF5_9BACT|nr:MAG: hypothetical protein COV72_06200 [Candidatus Omnitrophica bacterium CG11_big_fil_rev_8_21_14_0_20_42_13]
MVNLPKFIRNISLLSIVVFLPSLVFSNLIQEESKIYRDKGYEAQKIGDFSGALMFYEKAMAIDSANSALCNDLGVLYEQMGNISGAKEMYLKALQINPNYAQACYNLASLYEAQGDFLEAAHYWHKRMYLGAPGDAGAFKAKVHLRNIGQIYPEIAEKLKSQEVRELTDYVNREYDEQYGGDKNMRNYMAKARMAYKSEDYLTVLKNLNVIMSSDPRNQEAHELLEKTQKKILLKY